MDSHQLQRTLSDQSNCPYLDKLIEDGYYMEVEINGQLHKMPCPNPWPASGEPRGITFGKSEGILIN